MLKNLRLPGLWPGIIVLFLFILVFVSTFHNGRYPLGRMTPSYRFVGAIDWPIFMEAAKAYLQTGIVYSSQSEEYAPGAAIYKFPPLYLSALVAAIETGIDDQELKYRTAQLHIMLYFAALALCVFFFRTQQRILFFSLCGLLAITFDPFIDTLARLQAETFILFLISASMILCHKKYFFLAGSLVGLAASIKVYPLVYVAIFIAQRRYQGLWGVAAGILLSAIGSVFILGHEVHKIFYGDVLPILLGEPVSADLENISLAAAGLWLGLSPIAASWLSNAVLILSVVSIMWWWNSRLTTPSVIPNQKGDAIFPIAATFSLLTAALVLGMKNSWLNYQLLLIIPMICCLAFSLRGGSVNWIVISIVVLACLLMFFGKPVRLAPYYRMMSEGDSLLLWTSIMRALANILIWCVALYVCWRTIAIAPKSL